MECDHTATLRAVVSFKNFYPRTPVECDQVCTAIAGRIRISIHALLWSATKLNIETPVIKVISIHALLWSATSYMYFIVSLPIFLSTHSCGVRRSGERRGQSPNRFLSTHSCGVRQPERKSSYALCPKPLFRELIFLYHFSYSFQAK